MNDWAILAFAVAGGFTLSGMVMSLDAAMRPDGPRFRASFGSPGESLWSVALSMFGGPGIVAAGALRLWRGGSIDVVTLALAGVISLVWSLCSGILALQALAMAGVLGAA